MKRMLVVAVLAVMPVVGGAACGGGGSDTPADTITKPIDKAEDTADAANEREADLESKLADP